MKENRREIGFEYDNDITSDVELCQKILQSGTYTPSFENMIDFSEDLSRIIVKISLPRAFNPWFQGHFSNIRL